MHSNGHISDCVVQQLIVRSFCSPTLLSTSQYFRSFLSFYTMPVTDWVCIKCGVTNSKTSFKCQTCQQPKPIFWECTSCKVKNPINALKCSGCKRKRPAIFANPVTVKDAPKSSGLPPGGSSSESPSPTPQSSSIVAGTPTSTVSSIGGPVTSTISQVLPNATSTLSQSVSSYDVFVK